MRALATSPRELACMVVRRFTQRCVTSMHAIWPCVQAGRAGSKERKERRRGTDACIGSAPAACMPEMKPEETSMLMLGTREMQRTWHVPSRHVMRRHSSYERLGQCGPAGSALLLGSEEDPFHHASSSLGADSCIKQPWCWLTAGGGSDMQCAMHASAPLWLCRLMCKAPGSPHAAPATSPASILAAYRNTHVPCDAWRCMAAI